MLDSSFLLSHFQLYCRQAATCEWRRKGKGKGKKSSQSSLIPLAEWICREQRERISKPCFSMAAQSLARLRPGTQWCWAQRCKFFFFFLFLVLEEMRRESPLIQRVGVSAQFLRRGWKWCCIALASDCGLKESSVLLLAEEAVHRCPYHSTITTAGHLEYLVVCVFQ